MSDTSPSVRPAGERTLLEGAIHYLNVLLHYKWLIVAVTALSVPIAVGFSILTLALPPERSPLPNTYRAYAVILLQQEDPAGLESTLASLGLVAPEVMQGQGFDYSALAIKVLNSREFLDTLIEEFEIHERFGIPRSNRTKARKLILAGSGFDYDRTTRTLTISYAHIDPVFANRLVTRMVELLNDWFLTRGGTNRQRRKALLEEKLAEVSGDIEVLEEQVKDFQQTYGVLRVEDLAASQFQTVDNLRAQLRLKEIEIQNYTRFVKIEDPTLLTLRAERENLIDQIRAVESGLANPTGGAMPSRSELPELAQRFENLTGALRIQKNIYEALSQQFELTKLSLESEPVFTVLDPAEVPDEKTGPSRGRISMITVFLALIASVVVALLLNALRNLSAGPAGSRRLKGRVE